MHRCNPLATPKNDTATILSCKPQAVNGTFQCYFGQVLLLSICLYLAIEAASEPVVSCPLTTKMLPLVAVTAHLVAVTVPLIAVPVPLVAVTVPLVAVTVPVIAVTVPLVAVTVPLAKEAALKPICCAHQAGNA